MQVIPLVIVCDWIPPAFGAVGQYEYARALAAAASGRQVTLIGLGSGELETKKPSILSDGSVRVIRIPASLPDKQNLIRRGIWTVRTNTALLHKALKTVDEIIETHGQCELKVTGSPPFLSYAVLAWRWMFRGRFSVTYRITDFYPETIIATGRGGALRSILPIVHALRCKADRIEALSDCQARRLTRDGVPRNRIDIVRDTSPIPILTGINPAARPFGPSDIVLLYSGNLGVAHDWRSFAEGYRRHIKRGANRVRLWLNGTGVGVPKLKAFCDEHDLPFHLTPPSALDKLPSILAAADAHLILLGDPFWGYVFPSKTYASLESGKPCLFVGPRESDVYSLLSDDKRNSCVPQDSPDRIALALDRLERIV